MPLTRWFTSLLAFSGAWLFIAPIATGQSDPSTEPAPMVISPPPPPGKDAPRFRKPDPARPMSVGVEPTARARANRQTAADPVLEEFLQGAGYTVVNEGPWSTVRSKKRIGVVRELKLDRTVDTPLRAWPVLVWDDAKDTFQKHTYRAAYENVATVRVYLSAEDGIIALVPGPEATVKPGAGNEWVKSLRKDPH
jgi:hypothetical protein